MSRYLSFILIILLYACSTPGNTPSTRYTPSKIKEKPDEPRDVVHNHMFYHHNDFNSTFYFEVSKENLLFVNDNNMNSRAQLALQFSIKNLRSEEIVDSGTIFKKYNNTDFESNIHDSILLASPMDLLEINITIKDVNRNFSQSYRFQTNKKLLWETYNFKVFNQNKMHYDRRSYQDSVTIVADRMANQSLLVKTFDDIDNIATPPFSEGTYKPNLEKPLFQNQIKFGSNGHVKIATPISHTLLFTGNEMEKNGFFLLRFSSDFPKLKTVASLVPPLRYITSRDEFGSLSDTTNQRKKFEQFWISKGGKKDEARYLIKIYYNRVEYANKMFTSYKEGWKTDRGMIYIIFGAPDFVYKNIDSEKWVYEHADNLNTMRFDFYNEGSNSYSLIRNSLFKSSWYVAVENWRAGRAYKY